MIFSDFYKSPRSPLSKLRHTHNQGPAHLPVDAPDWAATQYADLLSKDKSKQKEAVKRYLSDKVRSDWVFSWPPESAETPPHDQVTQTTEGQAQGQSEPQGQDEHGDDDDGYQLDESPAPSDADDAADQQGDAQSVYSLVSEDDLHFRPRVESTSDMSDDAASEPASAGTAQSPEALQLAAQNRALERRDRHRRALRDEMTWNDGLACFEARRNAWTGARTVRVRSKPPSPALASPRSPRRFFFRHPTSTSPTASMQSTMAQTTDGASDASSYAKDNDKELRMQKTQDSTVSDTGPPESHRVEVLVPVGQPLLPPHNGLRASITPAVYVSLYDKVVVSNLQPACPVNLADMLRSCVAGWKRDGEWPPRASAMESTMATRKSKKASAANSDHGGNVARRMSFGLLGREKDEERSRRGFRRSIQRVLGIGLAPGNPDEADGEKAKQA